MPQREGKKCNGPTQKAVPSQPRPLCAEGELSLHSESRSDGRSKPNTPSSSPEPSEMELDENSEENAPAIGSDQEEPLSEVDDKSDAFSRSEDEVSEAEIEIQAPDEVRAFAALMRQRVQEHLKKVAAQIRGPKYNTGPSINRTTLASRNKKIKKNTDKLRASGFPDIRTLFGRSAPDNDIGSPENPPESDDDVSEVLESGSPPTSDGPEALPVASGSVIQQNPPGQTPLVELQAADCVLDEIVMEGK